VVGHDPFAGGSRNERPAVTLTFFGAGSNPARPDPSLKGEMAMKKTGVFVSEEDFEKLERLVRKGWKPGETMIVFSVGEGIKKDRATVDALITCHRLALAYGLPEIPGYYGITLDREFVRS
jgi:hypothetical protein